MINLNLNQIIYKIKTSYSEYLTGGEKQILDNNPEESDIRKIVNQIWDKYLTDPFDFTGNNEFCYLVKKNDLIFIEPVEFEEFPVFQDHKHYLEILSNENILEEKGGRVGFVVKVNWQKTEEIYLPDDLIKGKNVRVNLFPIAIFCVNIGEGKVNTSYDFTNTISNENNLLFLNLNLRNYNLDYKLSLGDKERIINGLIAEYLLDKPEFSNIEEHMRLRKTYGSYIIKKYNILIKENLFKDDSFIKEMTEYLDYKENNQRIKFNK